MKVKELIEVLSKFDPELEVRKTSHTYDGWEDREVILKVEEVIVNRCRENLPNINLVVIN
jgi:hypothetical protein